MISSNAIQYTLSHLLKVAFPMPEPPGFVFEVAENSVTVTLAEHLKLRMAQFSNEETALFCNGNAQRLLHHIRSADELADIPVFQPVACTLSWKSLTISQPHHSSCFQEQKNTTASPATRTTGSAMRRVWHTTTDSSTYHWLTSTPCCYENG